MGIVRIKRSSTQNSVPSDLLAGELAINVADRRLYAIDGNNTLKYINFTSDTEKVTSGPIGQAFTNVYGGLNGKLANNSIAFINATDDADAATKGVVLNGFYRNGNVVMTRIV